MLTHALQYSFDEAIASLWRGRRSDLAKTVGSLESNPLPASYDVRLQPQSGSSSGVDELAQRLRTTAGVADVRYDRQWLERLTSTIGIVRMVGLALAGILIVAAAL